MNIDNLSGFQFESFVAIVLRRAGYKNVRLAKKTNDLGADIFIGKNILVECKHKKQVGRPVLQKLQGAMLHFKRNKGMIVTSGTFTKGAKEYKPENIELINGKQLRKICEDNNIIILNGKIQVITNKAITHPDRKEIKKLITSQLKKIKGFQKANIKTEYDYIPAYLVRYNIHEYKDFTAINGMTGKELEHLEYYFKEKPKTEKRKIKEQYEYTEEELIEKAKEIITKKHTETTIYKGSNNQTYQRQTKPKTTDITIFEAIPLYLPIIRNEIKIKKEVYEQEILAKGDDLLYLENELGECSITKRKPKIFRTLYLNKEGKITCWFHKKGFF
ncbi:restriction endonuclease [Candidatus Woesearchaeota archaeon]|nr:restriction endonuclease [Candidatus Woesearchaeota archaeon]